MQELVITFEEGRITINPFMDSQTGEEEVREILKELKSLGIEPKNLKRVFCG